MKTDNNTFFIPNSESIGYDSVIIAYGKEYTSITELCEDQKIINENGGLGYVYVLNKNCKK